MGTCPLVRERGEGGRGRAFVIRRSFFVLSSFNDMVSCRAEWSWRRWGLGGSPPRSSESMRFWMIRYHTGVDVSDRGGTGV